MSAVAQVNLKFVTSDNKEFLIPANIIKMSNTVKDMLVGLGLDTLETTNADAIPLQNVDGKTLEKVIVWCKHHLEHPVPAPAAPVENKELSPFATDFFKVSQTEVFELILAANFLDIDDLLDAGCKTIADSMKGLSPQELRDKFEIVGDFTAEEQEEVSNDNKWASK